MGREYRIITALAPTDVPVAPSVGICTDDTTNGAPFYVMDYVDGIVVRSGADTAVLDADARAAASQSLVDTLGQIHAVDIFCSWSVPNPTATGTPSVPNSATWRPSSECG